MMGTFNGVAFRRAQILPCLPSICGMGFHLLCSRGPPLRLQAEQPRHRPPLAPVDLDLTSPGCPRPVAFDEDVNEDPESVPDLSVTAPPFGPRSVGSRARPVARAGIVLAAIVLLAAVRLHGECSVWCDKDV